MGAPLPARANRYVVEHPDATPDEVLREADLPESRREQVELEHHYTVTRYTPVHDCAQNADERLKFNRIECASVTEWDMSPIE